MADRCRSRCGRVRNAADVCPPVAVVPQSSPPAAANRIFTEEEGPCTLKRSAATNKQHFKVEVGKKLHGVFRFYVEDSADGPHITTNVSVENATKTDRHFRYEITFLDKSGEPINFFPENVSGEGNLVGRGAACNRETCSLLVPDGTSETVASYKVRFYETDENAGEEEVESWQTCFGHEKSATLPTPPDCSGGLSPKRLATVLFTSL